MKHLNRRKFLGTSGMLMGGLALPRSLFGAPNIITSSHLSKTVIAGVNIGVQTYSFRSMPDQSVEAVLQYTLDTGIRTVELWGDAVEIYAGKPKSPVNRGDYYRMRRAQRNGELDENRQAELAEIEKQLKIYQGQVAQWRSKVSMAKFKEVRKMYEDAGVTIFAYKPRAFEKNNTDLEIDWGMRAARALGADHVTLEHPGDDAHTLKLGNMGKKHKMGVGYHGHEQQTPTLWDTALEQSEYNGLNLDLGHYVAAGNKAPLDIMMDKGDRILSMHIKDRQTPANGKANLAWGSGDTPIAEALQLMRDRKYDFPATVEMEYDIPAGSDAVREVKKCLEYCQNALS